MHAMEQSSRRVMPKARTRALATALAVSAGVALANAPSRAAADPAWTIQDGAPHKRFEHLDLTLSAWFSHLGVSVWYSYPIVSQGFFRKLNDSFHIEGGAYLAYHQRKDDDGYLGIAPLCGVRWDFHLTAEWTVFATAKLGAMLGIGDSLSHPVGGGSVGAFYELGDGMAIRLSTGYPGGAQAGISFDL